MSVWPVLKSLPPVTTPFFSASSRSAGMSCERFGAPFRKGIPALMAAYA